jgi:hypothetical protein
MGIRLSSTDLRQKQARGVPAFFGAPLQLASAPYRVGRRGGEKLR